MKNRIFDFIKKTFVFRGRTNRIDYWTYFLVIHLVFNVLIISLLVGIFESWYIKSNDLNPTGLLFTDFQTFVNLIFILPLISGTIRRIRDAGFSPWLTLVPMVNLILCIFPTKKDDLQNS